MGNMCSSSQASPDQDTASNHSESPPCFRGRHRAKKKASNSSSSQCNVNDVKQERNGKVDVVDREGGTSGNGNGSQATHKRHVDAREESSMASVDSQLDGVAEVSSPPPSSAQLHQQQAGSDASRSSQAAAASAASAAAATSGPVQPGVDPLSCLPETVRQCLSGCIPCVRTPERGVNLALYITPADSNAGGLSDVLQEAVSQVQEVCNSRGVSLQVFDLCREAARQGDGDERMERIFLSTLTRLMETTHLIPMLIFNDTLGSTLLPRGIEAQDFQTALAATGDPADRSLVETWYRLDQKTQPPCYRLQSSPPMDPSIQRRLLEIFISIFSPELSDAYLTTLFEQEVHNSVCMSQELARRCVWIQHGAAAPSAAVGGSCIIEQENRRRVNATQKALKSLLQEKHILKNGSEASTHLAATLQSIVEELLDDVEAKDVFRHVRSLPRSCLEEINQHIAFCQRAASCSVNRESALMAIKRYLTGNERHPFVIYGREGSGKTCLLARAAQNCHAWQPDRDTGVVLRFAGLTPSSHSVQSLLHSVTEQCCLLVTGRLPHVPHTLPDYKAVLHRLFDGESAGRNIVIILDGVDELEDFESSAELLCSWVPRQLPANVKLLLTLRDPQLLQSKMGNSGALHQLEELSPNEARNLFNACLLQHAHSSHVDQVVSVESKIEQCHLPVTVKIFSWQAGLLDSFRHEDTLASIASPDIVSSLSTVIGDIIDPNQAAKMISFLTSSRYGLCDHEMEQLCQLHMPSAGKNLWPKLAHFLAPFLCRVVVGGLSLVSWRDVTVGQQMMAHYLADDETRTAIHSQMLDYYQQVWRQWRATLTQPDQTSKMAAVFSHSDASSTLRLVKRALDEIPHHLCKARQSSVDQWLQLMTDFVWLLAKLATSGVVQVVEDLNLALRHHQSDQLQSIRKMLILSAPALNYDYRQLYGQLQGRNRPASDASLPGLQTWLDQCRKPLISCFVPSQPCLNGHLPCSEAAAGDEVATIASAQVYFSAIHRLVGEPDQAAALSTVRDEMSLWDFRNGSCDKVLYNLHQPSKVAPMPNHRCVVLCGRELRVYDISTGEELLKLKGIMNQKLPLFGLHGDSHVVSLSRNRMYVNLISLENGDCVTTFKVGEDRFLNSLLVSDNGRILVCGDESKRPCSLLVWDLQAKKLIYDLKMNHHEFITRLSAITGEGTYVSCVCKELETNDPNFIVVYDLQSGTLFKKWKAGANTVAVTIACQNTCVVTSLEDARILVWDLVTGNCRWSLLGHTSAVDMLNLDVEGTFLLTWDSNDNDRSLRLWNLSNGQDVATFTPDQRTTAAQLSADGLTVLVALAGRSDLLQLNLSQPNFLTA